MNTIEQLHDDYRFCMDHPEEFKGRNGGYLAPVLRTVAALNTEVSKAEFVQAMVMLGINAKTAAIQFAASRKIDAEY
jgi:hypothetical protein